MKATIISASALALLGAVAVAQTVAPAPRGVSPFVRADAAAIPAVEVAPVGSDAQRFNLSFPGGKVRAFVDAVTKALGKPVNVIIPKETEDTTIPPVDVFGVTVSALFGALSEASKRQILVPSKGAENSRKYLNVGFNFASQDRSSPDAVWTFHVITPPELRSDEPSAPQRLVQFYPVAEYLSHFTVEDITTAIESGWQLQGGDSPKSASPILRFHEETKLLICAGSNQQLDIIPQVLTGLGQLLGYPRTDDLKITRKAREIVIAKVEFREAMVQEALDFMRRKALENDPEKKGINILLNEVNGPAEKRLTISLSEIPLLELLRFTAELAELDFQIRDTAIVLSTGGRTNASEPRPYIGDRGAGGAAMAPGRRAHPNAAEGGLQPSRGIGAGTPSAQDRATSSGSGAGARP